MKYFTILPTASYAQLVEAMPITSFGHGYQNFHHKEDDDVGLAPIVEIDQKGIQSTSTEEVFEMTALLDQESKVHIGGEERV